MAGKTLKKRTRTTPSSKRNRGSKGTTRSRATGKSGRRPPVVVLAAIGAVVLVLVAYGITMLFTGAARKTSDVPSYTADQVTLLAKEISPDCFTKASCG